MTPEAREKLIEYVESELSAPPHQRCADLKMTAKLLQYGAESLTKQDHPRFIKAGFVDCLLQFLDRGGRVVFVVEEE